MKKKSPTKKPKNKQPLLLDEFAIKVYANGDLDFDGFDYFLRRGLRRSCWQCLVKNLKRRGYKFYRKSKGG
ncbi:MAG: hypothetical protein AAB091_07620 [Elusimicrobiota bacterium]